jgi:Bifunctional DNA primase/polymerase, N-terminal/Protein of unknown function (DUF3987)
LNESANYAPDIFEELIAGETVNPSGLLEYALDCIREGLFVFPLLPKNKRPIAGSNGFLDASKDESIVRDWWTRAPESNIGIACGASNLCVLDFDNGVDLPEWLRNIKTLKVETSRGIHVYLFGARPSAKMFDSNGKHIGEIKSEGGYVLAPGSQHPDGPVYKVIDDSPIVPAPTEEIAKLLKSEIRERPSLTGDKIPFGQHDNELTRIGGKLRHDGMEEESITAALIEVCEKRCENYGSDYKEMCQKIAHSVCRYPIGKDSTVLCNGVPTGASTAVTNEIEAEPSEEVEEPLPDFPRLSGSLSQLSDALCPDIPYEFKIMSAVTHWGLIRSGLDVLENEPHLQPRFYTCFIKEPGWGKSAALNEVRTIMQILSVRYSAMSSVDSGPGLVDEFSDRADKMKLAEDDKSARVLLDPDEMRDLFEKAKVSSQGRNSLFTELLKLYESNRTGNRSRKAGKSQIENAHLAILAGATPQGYETMWTGTGGGSLGLQSRFVLVSTKAGKMPIQKTPTDGAALVDCVKRLQDQAAKPGQIVKLDAEAAGMLRDWWSKCPRDKPSESRVDDMVKRLLIVLAVTNDTQTITRDLMDQGIRFGEYIIATREKFNPMDSHSWTQAFEQAIEKVAQRHRVPMTLTDFRRFVQPTRRPGGIGPFLQGWKNMIAAGLLKPDGVTHKGTIKYRL